MKVIYVAGPFRGPTAWDIAENIRAAERIGLLVAHAGAMPLIPHSNTAYFHGQRDAQFWLDGTMELLRRCDGVVFIPGWRNSVGSIGEWEECVRTEKPWANLDGYEPHDIPSRLAEFLELELGKEDSTEEHGTPPSPATD